MAGYYSFLTSPDEEIVLFLSYLIVVVGGLMLSGRVPVSVYENPRLSYLGMFYLGDWFHSTYFLYRAYTRNIGFRKVGPIRVVELFL